MNKLCLELGPVDKLLLVPILYTALLYGWSKRMLARLLKQKGRICGF